MEIKQRPFNIVLVIMIIFFVAGCGSASQLVSSWVPPNSKPQSYENLGIVALLPSQSTKAIVEQDLAYFFLAKGVRALPTFDIFPFAGNLEIFKDQMKDPDFVRNKIKERLDKFNIDALLIVSLLDTEKVAHYKQKASIGMTIPSYSTNYYGYYSYAYNAVYTTGYYEVETTYFIDANLYDVATERLIWSGQSKTQNPTSVIEESKNYARIITEDIFRKEVLKR